MLRGEIALKEKSIDERTGCKLATDADKVKKFHWTLFNLKLVN